MSQTSLRPPIKIHGGKSYLKWFIIDNFPKDYQDLIYCEPMCGGASVFLNKQASKQEILNDLDKGITNIFKSLRDEPNEFLSKIKSIKYNEKTFKNAVIKSQKPIDDYVEYAVNEYVLRRMSRGGMKRTFAWSDRQRGGQPGDVNAWETMIKEIPQIAKRVQKAVVLNKNFIEIIKAWDEENVLFYIDPPYLHSTRSEGSTKIYDYEMSVDDHMSLLHMIKNCRSKIILSGYSSPLYNRYLKEWRCKKKNIVNHSSQGKVKERRIEVVWMNY